MSRVQTLRDQQEYVRELRNLRFGLLALIVPCFFAKIRWHLHLGAFAIFVLTLVIVNAFLSELARRKVVAKLKSCAGEPMGAKEQKTIRRTIRRLQIWIAILCICLFLGLWNARRATFPGLLVGIPINLLLQIFLIRTILRLKKRLKAEEN